MSRDFTQLFFVLFLSMFGAAMSVYMPGAVFVALVVLAIVWALSYKPIYGLYVLLFLYPMLAWQINFGSYESLQNTFLANINAPVADFWALILIAATALHFFRNRVRALVHHKQGTVAGQKFLLPGFPLFILFFLSAITSLFNVADSDVETGVQYIARNIIFIYAAYVLLPVNIVRRRAEIWRGARVLLIVGAFATLWGIASLFIVEPFWGIWRRVTPFAIDGWAPFGLFHNDLAEVLVAILPLVFYWLYRETRDTWRKIAFLYAVVMTAVTLLTFSRTAWIVLFVQVVIFMALSTRLAWRSVVRSVAPFAAIIVVPIAIYMLIFSGSSYVASSTSARVDLARIAAIAFAEHPIIGNGVGTYISLVAGATAFRIEYGPPFDAHGVIQKLAAEQGTLGLATFFLLVSVLVLIVYRAWRHEQDEHYKELLLAMLVIAVGAVVFQVFNTQYYTAKMWMPIGLALTAALLRKK